MAEIIIADDESITLTYLEDLLERKGHKVIGKAKSGPSAYKMALELEPDIVLLDIKMPGEYDGIEAGRRIEKEIDIPVIFVTAYSSNFYIEQVASFGAFGYIVKPFDESQVETAVYIALYRSRMEHKLKYSILKYKLELEYQYIIRYLLSKISKAIYPNKDIDELLLFICNSAKIDGIAIYQFLDEGCECLEQTNVSLIEKSLLPEFVYFNYQGEIDRKNVRKINLIKNQNQLPENLRSNFEKAEFKTMLTIPLEIEDGFYGVIAFIYYIKKSLGIEMINFLKIVADSIAIAFKRYKDYIKIKKMEEDRQIQEKILLRAEQFVSFGQLTSAIAHEIRQPLQSIKILTDSVLFWDHENKRMSYEDMLQNLKKISARVDRVEKIIKNMNLMIKSPDKIEIKPININNEIIQSIEFFKQKLLAHRIKLELNFDENIKEILFSDIQFNQVVVNIINNAINALATVNKNDKLISIKTEENNDYILLTIIDNGTGINDEIKEKVFDPFFSTYNKGEGTGMGLYIVKNILKCFNSSITVSDNEGGGAVFNILLNRKG